jgi:hypothetical protein
MHEGRPMDRKEFLKHAGIVTGSFALMSSTCHCFAGAPQEDAAARCEKKQEFTQTWAKTFFDLLDSNVDEATRKRLMQANGRACYQRGMKGRTIKPVPLDEYLPVLQKRFGKENCRREGDIIFLSFGNAPTGSNGAAGKCFCPMVESGPAGLSGTYCECSVGYVLEMFQTGTGRNVGVDLLESVKRGGKECRFRVVAI